MFEFIGRMVRRFWPLFLLGWVGLVVVLHLLAPRFKDVAAEGGTFLPEDTDSVKAEALLACGFPEEHFTSMAVVTLERAGGLEAKDLLFEEFLVRWLSSPGAPENMVKVISSVNAPFLEERLKSADGQAAIILAGFDTFYLSQRTVVAVKSIVEKLDRAPAGLNVAVTGDAGLAYDYSLAVERSLHRTTWVTLFLVVAILLVVYRAPVALAIPLLTVAVSFSVSRSVLALLAQRGMELPQITEIFLIVVLFGAATDYCLFLFSRFREERARGVTEAVATYRAVGRVGGAIGASAGTTACGLGLMWFARFGPFKTVGPAVGIGLLISLAVALTFSASLLRLLGRWLLWPRAIKAPQEGHRLWARLAEKVLSYPGRILLVSLVVLIGLGAVGFKMEPTYDVFSEMPQEAYSVRGVRILERHFRPGEMSPVEVVIRWEEGITTAKVFEAVRVLTHDLLGLSSVDEVRSAVAPLGNLSLRGSEEGSPRQLLDFGLSEALVRLRASGSYISSTGEITRLAVVLKHKSYSREAMRTLGEIRNAVDEAFKRLGIEGAEVHLAGATATINDIRLVTRSDLSRVMVLVLLGIFVILAVLLKKIARPAYLLATMVLSFWATLGITTLVFVYLFDAPALDWKVAFFLFVLLVAVGVDYNIFLMTRIREEEGAKGPSPEAVGKAIVATGGVISSCGVIMAGTFGSLMAGSLALLVQLGFALAVGLLLDTFLVRPVIVPSIVLLAQRISRQKRAK